MNVLSLTKAQEAPVFGPQKNISSKIWHLLRRAPGAPPVMPAFIGCWMNWTCCGVRWTRTSGASPYGLNISRMNSSSIRDRRDGLATRVSGHALGPRAAFAVRFFLRLLRYLAALRRVWLLSGCFWLVLPIGSPDGSPAQSIDRTCV